MEHINKEKSYNYMVMISCLTYNHEKYIDDALKGFIIQETYFPFLVIVVDDASTDNEQNILNFFIENELDTTSGKKDETEDYIKITAQHKKNNKCTFAIFLLKYNHYGKKLKSTYYKDLRNSAKYIATCEGDDYWTDPLKLQKQVDYLENHPECGLVYTNAQILNQESGIISSTTLPRQTDFEHLLLESPIMTLTTCYRNSCLSGFFFNPNWRMSDLPMWLYIAARFTVKYLPDVTATYRKLSNSISHFNNINKAVSFSLNSFDIRLFFAKEYHREHLIPKMAKVQINELFKIAISYNKNISGQIMRFALKHKVFDIKTWTKIILYATQLGRNYHQRKNA